jgi:hypothetical protein
MLRMSLHLNLPNTAGFFLGVPGLLGRKISMDIRAQSIIDKVSLV